jgi:threonine dehydrogenase-like Zn-dependent dehydrogenase
VAVFAQGPIGLCATAGAKLCGATTIIGVDAVPERMAVIASGRTDLKPLVTHRFKLDDIEAAYDLFGHQRDGVLKVAITP